MSFVSGKNAGPAAATVETNSLNEISIWKRRGNVIPAKDHKIRKNIDTYTAKNFLQPLGATGSFFIIGCASDVVRSQGRRKDIGRGSFQKSHC